MKSMQQKEEEEEEKKRAKNAHVRRANNKMLDVYGAANFAPSSSSSLLHLDT